MFVVTSIEFLGYVLSADSLRLGTAKLQVIKDYPIPKDEHEVRRFLRLASFFRRFVPKFAEKARPLTELIKKNVTFKWGDAEQRSFKLIKNNLVL